MASAPPPMASAPPGPSQPTPPQLDGSSQPLSWEGEKMFNIYIYDYCSKRGFRKTAHELMREAEISPESSPPIDARQGLLFEWWSVFWVLFTAKANGHGPEEAILYTQHQASQLAQRQVNQRNMQPPGQVLPGGQPPQPGMPHPPPMNRAPNGVAPRQGMMGFPSNGPMPNGVGPPSGPMQAGGPAGFMHQTNGIPQPGPPLPQGVPSGQGPNFQPMTGGPRSSLVGMPNQQAPPQGQQQRGPNPNGPFHSPNMASPQNPPGPPPQHPQPPMGHLNRAMLPPNQGMNPINPQGPTGAGVPPPTQYPQMGRSPSRAATPSQGQGGMMNPSPSMANRQPPGSIQMFDNMNSMNAQFMLLSQGVVTQIVKELGIEARDIAALSMQDKSKILSVARSRNMQPQPGNLGSGPPENAAAGPSNSMMMQAQRNNNPQQRNQTQPPQRGGKRNSTSPGEEHETLLHNDSSPPSNKRMRRSPMEQPNIPPGMNYNPQQPQNHPPQPGLIMNSQGQQSMIPMRVPGTGHMNGGGPASHPGQPPMGSGFGGMGVGPSTGPGSQPPMMPSMQHMPPQMGSGSLTPHMQSQQMQAREATMRHPGMMSKGPQMGSIVNMNAGSPPSADPSQFLGGGPQLGQGPGSGPGFNQNRMGQKAMGPPPSPALNGPPKDQKPPLMSGGQGNAKNPMQNPNIPANHNSPRNPPLPGASGVSSAGQTPNMGVGGVNGVPGPSTPVPGSVNPTPTPAPGPMGGPPPPPPPPSATAGLGDPGMVGSMGGLGESDSLFTPDFIHSVAGSLDAFDPRTFLEPTGDINFERDFGQWFNPDDAMSGLDMK